MSNLPLDVDHQKLVKEIADLVRPVDYHGQGYVTTREVAVEAGISMAKAFKLLERLVDEGKAIKQLDNSRIAWWKLL